MKIVEEVVERRMKERSVLLDDAVFLQFWKDAVGMDSTDFRRKYPSYAEAVDYSNVHSGERYYQRAFEFSIALAATAFGASNPYAKEQRARYHV